MNLEYRIGDDVLALIRPSSIAPSPPPSPPQPIDIAELKNGACDASLFGHDIVLHCRLSRLGRRMVTAECRLCALHTSYIKHAAVQEHLNVDVATLEIEQTNVCQWCDGVGCSTCVALPCARCRQYRPTHQHHIAPRALFVDADYWPIVDLCHECHAYWHKIVTPNLRKNPQPPPPHLRDEWNDYQDAVATLQALNHPQYPDPCDCGICGPFTSIVKSFRTLYGWTCLT